MIHTNINAWVIRVWSFFSFLVFQSQLCLTLSAQQFDDLNRLLMRWGFLQLLLVCQLGHHAFFNNLASQIDSYTFIQPWLLHSLIFSRCLGFVFCDYSSKRNACQHIFSSSMANLLCRSISFECSAWLRQDLSPTIVLVDYSFTFKHLSELNPV